MPKLCQIIAVEKGLKGQAESELTRAYHNLAKAPLLSGISRTYRPRDEEGDQLPPESTRVQLCADAVIADVVAKLTRMFDVVATKEVGNCGALADVVVGDTTLLTAMPVTVLLFLEKQLVDLATFVRKLPTLDPSEQWGLDETTGMYTTAPIETVRTKKVPRNHERAPATDKHPAQVDMYFEDVPVGNWSTVKMSGALPAARVKVLVDRVEALQRAVKSAREAANSIEVLDVRIGKPFLDFLFRP